ncbi:serine hydrolase [Pediococcus stilesii]|uniref:Serine hydrolase n=2 Tax=Pediococcus stilesii TaxID=331679 RepID=A0A5R9BWX4_9LACO|nr:serine hydrolase [Pediococcus stilesii]
MLVFEICILIYFLFAGSNTAPTPVTQRNVPSAEKKSIPKATVPPTVGNEQADQNTTHLTDSQIKQRQVKIKKELNNYLSTVTKDNTASVSFYNLAPIKGSKADRNADSAVYQNGALEVSSNDKKVVTAASTYKLFIAAFLFSQKANGRFKWTTENKDAFNRMIVNSENTFGDQVIQKYGMSSMNSVLATQGWYSPVFSKTKVASTNSHSLLLLLKDLENGTGVFQNKADRKYLLDLMAKQTYRTGIPAGAKAATNGVKVQDKVGFLDDTNNDAGIVTLPNGQRYILVVMTHGHNQSNLNGFPRIAKITKKIQTIAYGSHS